MQYRHPDPVVIDPGHGGPDPGAIGPTGVTEATVAMLVALRLRNALEKQHQLRSELTHRGTALSEDKRTDLQMRARAATRHHALCLVSLHCNAADDWRAHGFEVWTTPGQTKADPLADRIYASVRNHFPEMRMRTDESDGDPDKEAWFAVIRGTPAPAVLVEMAFLSNPTEEILLNNSIWQERMVEAIARAIVLWLSNL